MNEFILIQKAKLGDKRSFEQLYDRYTKDLYKFIYYKVNVKEIAEDLSSETWIQVVKSLKNFSARSSFKTWLFGIAKNILLGFYNEKYANKENVSFEEFLEKDDVPNVSESLSSQISNLEPTNTVDEVYIEQEKKNEKHESKISRLLATLKPTAAKVLEMRFLKGYSIEEVANELDLSISNVKVTQMRAIAKLRKLGYKDDDNV